MLTSQKADHQQQMYPRPLKVNLSFHLKGHADLVATRVDIATVDEGGESDCDAVPQLLLVSKANLALVVDLGTQCRSIRENIFCSNSESSCCRGRAPSKGNPSLKGRRHLLVDRSTEVSSVDHAGVEDKVLSGVAKTEVVLGHSRLGEVKAGLVAGQPALMADHSSRVDGREAQVHVSSYCCCLMLVFSLQFARFGASGWIEGSVKCNLQPRKQLVSDVDGGVQGVVRAPLLSQGHAQLLHLIFGLEVASHLATVNVGRSARGELNSSVSLGPHLKFEETKMVSLAKHI